MTPLSLGFSPCPNDTFIFCGLVEDLELEHKPYFSQPFYEDVETLNRWAVEKRLDVTKLSFHALGHVLSEYCVLPAGSALGRGCGPLLVSTSPDWQEKFGELARRRIAIPGTYTTAALLLRMLLPDCRELVEMSFEHIMPAVSAGEVDAGVIIHEGRFTYQNHGLVCLQDLGEWWEGTTGLPIPLGCIAARRNLGTARLEKISERIRNSLERAKRDPGRCLEYIRSHAQEMEESVIRSHIDLYVNDFSLDLGDAGREAVLEFLARGRACGALPAAQEPVFCI